MTLLRRASVPLVLFVACILDRGHGEYRAALAQGGQRGEPVPGGWVGRASTTDFEAAGIHTGMVDGNGNGLSGASVVGSSMNFVIRDNALQGDATVSLYLKQYRADERSNYAGLSNFGAGIKLQKFCVLGDDVQTEEFYDQHLSPSEGYPPGSGYAVGFRLQAESACYEAAGTECVAIWECWWTRHFDEWEPWSGGVSMEMVESDRTGVLEVHSGVYSDAPFPAEVLHVHTWDHHYYYIDIGLPFSWCGTVPTWCASMPDYWPPWGPGTPMWRCERVDHCIGVPLCGLGCSHPYHVQPWGVSTWGPPEAQWPQLEPGALRVFNPSTQQEPSPGDTEWDVCMGSAPGTPCETPPPTSTPTPCAHLPPCSWPWYRDQRILWLDENYDRRKPVTWYLDQGSFDAQGEPPADWHGQAVAAANAWNDAWSGVLAEADSAAVADVVVLGKSDIDFTRHYSGTALGAVHDLWLSNDEVPNCDDPGAPLYAAHGPKEMWLHLGCAVVWNNTGTYQSENGWLQSRKNILMHEFGHALLLDHTSSSCPVVDPPNDEQEVLCAWWGEPVPTPVVVTPLISQPPALLEAIRCLYP